VSVQFFIFPTDGGEWSAALLFIQYKQLISQSGLDSNTRRKRWPGGNKRVGNDWIFTSKAASSSTVM
jgi:hypothetical protein